MYNFYFRAAHAVNVRLCPYDMDGMDGIFVAFLAFFIIPRYPI